MFYAVDQTELKSCILYALRTWKEKRNVNGDCGMLTHSIWPRTSSTFLDPRAYNSLSSRTWLTSILPIIQRASFRVCTVVWGCVALSQLNSWIVGLNGDCVPTSGRTCRAAAKCRHVLTPLCSSLSSWEAISSSNETLFVMSDKRPAWKATISIRFSSCGQRVTPRAQFSTTLCVLVTLLRSGDGVELIQIRTPLYGPWVYHEKNRFAKIARSSDPFEIRRQASQGNYPITGRVLFLSELWLVSYAFCTSRIDLTRPPVWSDFVWTQTLILPLFWSGFLILTVPEGRMNLRMAFPVARSRNLTARCRSTAANRGEFV